MKALLIVSLVLWSASALAQPEASQAAPIENVCGAAGASEAQRQTCVRQEELSRSNVDQVETDPATREFCRSMVGQEPAILNACIQQENLSKSRIEAMSVNAAIKERCEADSGGSYVKMESCLEEVTVTP